MWKRLFRRRWAEGPDLILTAAGHDLMAASRGKERRSRSTIPLAAHVLGAAAALVAALVAPLVLEFGTGVALWSILGLVLFALGTWREARVSFIGWPPPASPEPAKAAEPPKTSEPAAEAKPGKAPEPVGAPEPAEAPELAGAPKLAETPEAAEAREPTEAAEPAEPANVPEPANDSGPPSLDWQATATAQHKVAKARPGTAGALLAALGLVVGSTALAPWRLIAGPFGSLLVIAYRRCLAVAQQLIVLGQRPRVAQEGPRVVSK